MAIHIHLHKKVADKDCSTMDGDAEVYSLANDIERLLASAIQRMNTLKSKCQEVGGDLKAEALRADDALDTALYSLTKIKTRSRA